MNSERRDTFLSNCLLESLEDENYGNSKKLITHYKTNVNLVVPNRGIAPIHYAAGMENTVFGNNIMMIILKNGGNPNIKTIDGETPLHIAAIWNRELIVEMLLDHGADLAIKDEDGNTPINNAILEKNFSLIPLFQNYVFERKIDKKNEALKNNINTNRYAQNLSPFLQQSNDRMQRLIPSKASDKEVLTPNKTNFNFEDSSPFYINITHRKKKRDIVNNESVQNRFEAVASNSTTAIQTSNQKILQKTISVDPEIGMEENNQAMPANMTNKMTEFNKNIVNNESVQNRFEAVASNSMTAIQTSNQKILQKTISVDPEIGMEENNQAMPANMTNRMTEFNKKKVIRRTISVDPEIGIEKIIDEITCINLISDEDDDDADVHIVRENLFQLTEDNLERHLNMLPKKNRISLVDTWRKKVNKSRKRDTILPNNENDLDLFISKSTENFDRMSTSTPITGTTIIEINSTCNVPTSITSESYMTANNHLDETYVLNKKKDDGTVIQMEENYMHTDAENDIVFYEQKLLMNSNLQKDIKQKQNNDDYNNDDGINSVVTSETDISVPLDYDTDTLRKELTYIGFVPGPITKSTKRLYLKRLIRHKRTCSQGILVNDCILKSSKFPIEMLKTLRDENADTFSENIMAFNELEQIMIDGFSSCPVKRFREGNLKTSFIYLLIDPLISENLPAESHLIKKHETWKRFISSIFYVGKGKSSRPYAHLYDAIKIYQEKKSPIDLNTKYQDSLKLDRINEIWKAGKGVICLPVFHNIIPVEAYTREAAIIDSIGVENLTNIKRGDYYGISKSWTMRQRKQLGIVLLFKALHIFMAEGESQLRPNDIKQKKVNNLY